MNRQEEGSTAPDSHLVNAELELKKLVEMSRAQLMANINEDTTAFYKSLETTVLEGEIHSKLTAIKYRKNSGFVKFNSVPRQRKPPLRGLIRFADLFGLPTRKAIKALAGDYDAEIRRLRKAHRPRAAQWNVALAWGYSIWYVLRNPFDQMPRYLVKSIRG